MTGVRALAATAVVLFHFAKPIFIFLPLLGKLNFLFGTGHLGVDVFFVLSGFILAYNYSDRTWTFREYGRFLWLRLARIYPVHLLTLFVLTPIVLREYFLHLRIASEIDVSLRAWFVNIALLQGIPIFVRSTSWNFPAWSIGDEWLAYLLFPVAMLRIRGHQHNSLRLWLEFAGCFVLLDLIYRIIPDPQNPIQTGIPRILCEFTAGIVLYTLYRLGKQIHLAPSLLAVTGIAGACALVSHVRAEIWVIPVFALMILQLAVGNCWFSKILATRTLVYGGEISYSLYMTHALSQTLLFKLLPAARFAGSNLFVRIAVLSGYGLVILGIAVLAFELIEKPCRIAMRKAMDHRRAMKDPEDLTSRAQPVYSK